MIHKFRNPKGIEGFFQMRRIGVHVAGNHRHVPVAVAAFPYQTPDLGGHILRLLFRIADRVDGNRVCPDFLRRRCFPCVLPLLLSHIPEQPLFQQSHGRVLPEPPHRLFVQVHWLLHQGLLLPGNLHKPCHHLLADGKQLIGVAIHKGVFPLIHHHSDHHLFADLHQFSQKLILHRRKSGKSVQNHHAVLQKGRLRHQFAQYVQQFLLCNIFVRQIVLKSFVYRPDIRQFVIQVALRLQSFQKFIQLLHADPVLGELGDYGFHLADIPLFFQVPF